MPWPIAFSFARWRCADCREVVEWEDAICEEYDGKLSAIRHLACVEDDQ